MAGRLRVTEIFQSIQGESTWAGCPCVFVRLTGCHLRCTYCDTEYAFTEGRWQSLDEIVDAVRSHPANLVEITGGEPLLQPQVHALTARLCDLGKTVLIETSGACDISVCDPRAIRIMDLKSPGSGEADANLWSNLDHLTDRDEVKIVITDRADYDWARSVIEEHRLAERVRAVVLTPVFEQPPGEQVAGCPGLDPALLAQWILDHPPAEGSRSGGGGGVRMGQQLHKLIWDPQMRGV